MKLYLITRNSDGPKWDVCEGFVIRASSPSQARKIAAENHGDEGSKTWLNSDCSTLHELKLEGNEGVILRDYCNG